MLTKHNKVWSIYFEELSVTQTDRTLHSPDN
jgi:hypothetical protein